MPRASGRELASLLVHRFEAMDSVDWPQFELLTDQAVIDDGPSWACRNDQLEPRCSQSTIQCGQAWVGVSSLEVSNGCLADCQSLCEVGLG
jgi:hypothetical protein